MMTTKGDMMTKLRSWTLTSGIMISALALAACGGGGAADGGAETESDSGSGDFPTETIEIVVPAAAGGSTDAGARILALGMEEALGTTVVVVNREGASGVVGASEVADAEADGYTLMFTGDGVLLRSAIEDTPYAIDDFEAVGGFMASPYAVLVPADSPWESLSDVEGEPVTYGASGIGTLPQTMLASLLDEVGADATNVPFDGSAPAMQAALGDQVQMAIAEVQISEQFVQNGELRALAVSSPEPMEALPDTPTFDELGYADSVFNVSWGMVAPAGTPADRIEVLEEAMQEAASSQGAIKFIENGRLTKLEGEASSAWLESIKEKEGRYAEVIDRLGLLDN